MILHDGVILTKSGRKFSKPRNYGHKDLELEDFLV